MSKHGLLLLFALPLSAAVTFQDDVRPILEQHCQSCHRKGEIGPMPLETYRQTRPWASAIREQVSLRQMPPWFAGASQDGRFLNQRFSNDPSLSDREIATIREWAEQGAPEGTAPAAPTVHWPVGWNLARQDAIFAMPAPFELPASGAIDYQYFVIPTGFLEDRWIQAVEIRPGARANVHHVVVYVRPKGSVWLKGGLKDGNTRIPPETDILAIYTPGSQARTLPPGVAQKLEAGSDLVFQIHYTTNGTAARDVTKIGLEFAANPPEKRVLTLQMGNSEFRIPPGSANFPVMVRGTLPNDAELLSFFPHMHLRGKAFEYRIIPPRGPANVLLHVEPYHFSWQLTYVLREPLQLKAGTRFEWEAWFDNSPNNPSNPDPKAEVRYGEQSWEEMMIGFFEVAVPATVTKKDFFVKTYAVAPAGTAAPAASRNASALSVASQVK